MGGPDGSRLEKVVDIWPRDFHVHRVERLQRLADPIGEDERMPPHDPDRDLRVDVARLGQSGGEALGGSIRPPGRQLGGAQLAQHFCALLGIGRFFGGATKVVGGDVHRALGGRPARSGAQVLDDGCVPGRGRLHEVRRDRVVARARRGQDAGGTPMRLRARGDRHIGIDRRAHERVHERQAALVAQDLSPHKRRDHPSGLALGEAQRASRRP